MAGRPRHPTTDSSTYAQKAIEYEHSEIHAGDMYTVTLADADLDSAEVQEILILTPNTDVEQHFTWTIEASGAVSAVLVEGVTHATTPSTAPLNCNRRSSKAAGALYATTTTASTGGTTLWTAEIGAAARSGSGSSLGGRYEFILNKNVKYGLRVTSAADNTRISIQCWWYEHTRKEA